VIAVRNGGRAAGRTVVGRWRLIGGRRFLTDLSAGWWIRVGRMDCRACTESEWV